MLGGCEGGHIDADLGDQHLGDALFDAGDAHQQVTLGSERAHPLLDIGREAVDRLVEKVDVREDLPDHERVLVLEAADERLPERGDLRAQLSARELREHGRVGGAGHERVEHVAPGLPEDVGRDAPELDSGVLENLVQPSGLALAVVDLGLAIPGQVGSALLLLSAIVGEQSCLAGFYLDSEAFS